MCAGCLSWHQSLFTHRVVACNAKKNVEHREKKKTRTKMNSRVEESYRLRVYRFHTASSRSERDDSRTYSIIVRFCAVCLWHTKQYTAHCVTAVDVVAVVVIARFEFLRAPLLLPFFFLSPDIEIQTNYTTIAHCYTYPTCIDSTIFRVCRCTLHSTWWHLAFQQQQM